MKRKESNLKTLMKKRRWFLLSLALAGSFLGFLAGAFYNLIHDLPQINILKQYKPSSVTTVYSADKKILDRFYIEKRFPVSIDIIPESLIEAVLTIEDQNFFNHSGVNLKAVLRAIIQDIKAGSFKQGASTLTQQLAKTLFLTSEKSIVRKIKEAILTLQIERRYAKKEILELYLNQIYLGSGAYGVEAASKTYFGKSVIDLSLAEAALIAGMPKSPSVYSPLKNPELAEKRRNIVLKQMYLTGKIHSEEYEDAKAKHIFTMAGHSGDTLAPYFIEHIKQMLRQQFEFEKIVSAGLKIYTTLNFELQTIAQDSVNNHMKKLQERMNGQDLNGSQAQCALIAIDIKTGGILSMIGGIDFSGSAFNRAVQAKRQPGSAFKPFVYATALNKGYSQKDILLDAPLSYPLATGRVWTVRNFSRSYSGEMTFRKALSLSKNTPVVRLLEIIGADNVVSFAEKAGISSKLSPNLSLALGTSEVSLLELTAAYIPFANMGVKVTPYPISKITDSDSRLIFQHTIKKQSIMSRQNAAIMTDMLRSVILEGTGRKALRIQKDIAGKTGTSDNYKDALFIGYSPDIAVGVWVGKDNSSTLGKHETGAKTALPIWIDVMVHYLSRTSYQYFDIPEGTKMVYMNPSTGKLHQTKTSDSVRTLLKHKKYQ